MPGYISKKMWKSPRGQFQYERDLLYHDPKTAESTGKLIKPITKEKLTNITRKRDQTRVGQFQTEGKKSLLTSKSTRSKGGGGKGGTFGGIRGLKSPWQMIKRFLD